MRSRASGLKTIAIGTPWGSPLTKSDTPLGARTRATWATWPTMAFSLEVTEGGGLDDGPPAAQAVPPAPGRIDSHPLSTPKTNAAPPFGNGARGVTQPSTVHGLRVENLTASVSTCSPAPAKRRA